MTRPAHIIDCVRQALASGRTLRIEGGNSKDFMGREIHCDQRLCLADHAEIVEYKPIELVMTAKAGTPIATINATLAEHNQYLPAGCDDFFGKATLGGSLASNINGAARPWNGALRDLILGSRLINGKGEHLRFGGKVMKNVAGYDISRLQAGAFGTLGVIEELSFKVLPKPSTSLTLSRPLAADDAIQWMNTLAMKPLPINGAAWLNDALYIRLAGTKNVVEHAAKTIDCHVDDDGIWDQIERAHALSRQQPRYRLSVRPNAPSHGLKYSLINWAGAERWVDAKDFDLPTISAIANTMGGEVSLIGRDASNEVVPPMPAGLMALQKRVKAAMDPKGIFNPGKLFSWN